jgi:PAS domain S-box-containing protein
MAHSAPPTLSSAPAKLRVLILEDSPLDAKLAQITLEREGFSLHCEVVDSRDAFQKHLEESEYDLILADYNLRTWTALDALDIVKHSGKDIPLIVVTGTVGDETAVECIKRGAADYVLKDQPIRLPVAVRRALEDKHLRRERTMAEEALRGSEARYRVLFERNLAGIVQTSADGRILDCNESFARILGYNSREQALGNSIQQHWFNLEERNKFAEQVKRKGRVRDVELRLRRTDGQAVWVLENASFIRQSDNQGIAFEATLFDITDRMKAQEDLALFKRSIDAHYDGAYWTGADNRFIYVNDAACAALGYERKELLGRSILDVNPKASPEGLKRVWEILRSQGFFSTESIHRRKDGSEFPVEIVTTYMRFGGREFSCGFARDITTRKHAEEALRDSEERFRTLVENAPVAIGIGRDGLSIYANQKYLEMFGVESMSELVGRPVAEDWVPECRGMIEGRAKLRALGQPVPSSFEATGLRRDGRSFPAHIEVATVNLPDGPASLAFITDVSERKSAEEERSRLLTAIEQAAEGVVITDTDGIIQYVNPAFSAITGYSRNEALGQNPRILKSGEHDSAFYERMWRDLLAGRVWRGEIVNRRKDGTLYTERMSVTPIHNERGVITHFIAMKEDITAKIHLEAQFRAAQKMEAVGRLAAGVAHDFNNILTIINGYSEMLATLLPEESLGHEYAQEIKGAGNRATGLTRQLLAFTRQQVLAPRLLDLNALVTNIEKMLRRLIGEDIHLSMARAPDLWTIKADPGQIEQVIMNLAVNARDAMPRGGKLTLETSNVEVDEASAARHPPMVAGRFTMLAVTDTGCGMSAETQSHIFEPFFTTKEVGKGTGLGLATVYGIVKQSGGFIWVYSEVGIGTTFKIYLPPEDEALKVAEAKERTQWSGGTETIMVVEDDPNLRSLVRKFLEGSGYNVVEAHDGQEALLLGRQRHGPIHLLLTDLVMPGMGGRELGDILLELQPELKVLYMSGYTDDTVVRHGELDTSQSFLQKPFTSEALLRKVREILDA